jgi:hypothetical protein
MEVCVQPVTLEAGSELVAVACEQLNKVKQALLSRSNMDKTLKEEAVQAVSEVDSMLNRLRGMFLGLECTLKKAITTAEKERTRTYSEILVTSLGTQANGQKQPHPVAQPRDRQTPTFGIVVKATDPNTSSQVTKTLIKEAVDPKALKLGVSKLKNLANNAVFVECNNTTDRDILEKELAKLKTVTVERPKKKLPTLLLKFVPKEVEDAEIIDTILQQNNLAHLEDPILNIKFIKNTFEDSRHVVIEVSSSLRRELVALRKIKLHWSLCQVEDFIVVTRCLKCLGFGHTTRFCQNQQKCSNCTEDHHWRECSNQHSTRCVNCLKANSFIHDDSNKLNPNHSVFSKECPRMRRIESIIINKTDYSS